MPKEKQKTPHTGNMPINVTNEFNNLPGFRLKNPFWQFLYMIASSPYYSYLGWRRAISGDTPKVFVSKESAILRHDDIKTATQMKNPKNV